MSDRPPRGGMLGYIAAVLLVSDLSRSVAFYRDRLEFDVVFVYEGRARIG